MCPCLLEQKLKIITRSQPYQIYIFGEVLCHFDSAGANGPGAPK
jgi:hypothetical protein